MGTEKTISIGDALRMVVVVGAMLLSNTVMVANAEYLRAAMESDEQRRELKVDTWSVEAVVFYALMPFISGVIGYGTNVVALKLTFFPYTFWGWELYRFKDQPVGLFGWQGIVPTKAEKMASDSVDLMTAKLFNIKEIFARIEVDKAANELKKGFQDTLDRMIERVSNDYILDKDTSWKRTESAIKSQITSWALGELPGFTAGFMGELVEDLDDVYDLKHMCVTEMVNHPEILVSIFRDVGMKELIFIERSGFWFGALFGLIQMVLVAFVIPKPWDLQILPVTGFIVGFATNYIALYMIFSPIEPVKIGPYTMQGLFLKRQREASATFASKMVGTVLHSERIWWYMMNGPKSARFEELLRKHADEFTERMIGYTKPLVLSYMGSENFAKMRKDVQDLTVNEIENIVQYMHDYTDSALDLETEIRTKMSALPSRDFEQVLHPVFQEDEIKLIIVGGVLGAGVGAIQWLVSSFLPEF